MEIEKKILEEIRNIMRQDLKRTREKLNSFASYQQSEIQHISGQLREVSDDLKEF